MKLPQTIEIIPGMTLIPASDTYPIGDRTLSGTFNYFTPNGAVIKHKFHLINKLCTKEEMVIFNLSGLNGLIIDKLHKYNSGEVIKIFAINWCEHVGLGLVQ